ncbi:tRNA pseudouridine synthase A, partial [Yersinia pestis PY-65]
MKIALGIEYNG